jgi:uncharacterized protein YbgA (DUF1722 family)/uncharacterized protein YbbK (DUF523 family)
MNTYKDVNAPMTRNANDEIRIGISACMLGEEVRFDGGHKRDPFLVETLGQFVRFVPVCPEVDIGLGTPREAIRLEKQQSGVRLIAPKSGADHTEAMALYAAVKVRELRQLDLSGYILKKDSPTCGMERVRIYEGSGMPNRSGRGLFADVLLRELPLLPVEEEGRIHDPHLRENFLERVFAYRRLRLFFNGKWRVGDLVRLHAAEKYLLLAHDNAAYETLGRLVAGAKAVPRAELAAIYQQTFMTALTKIATARRQANVLTHMAGYFKRQLSTEEKAELGEVVEDFRRGLVPAIVPITLIRHYVRLYKVEYLAAQTYMQPHPKELMLRNHV